MHPVILKAYLEEFLKGVEEKEAMGRTLEFLTGLSTRRPGPPPQPKPRKPAPHFRAELVARQKKARPLPSVREASQ